MENNHKLCLYVSYYLSRFDKVAYKNLGFGKQNDTHKKIGALLSVNPHSVRNWRDEFDPLFGHRAGWHQRPMNPSRINVANAFECLNEKQAREIILDILSGKIKEDPSEESQLLAIATESSNVKQKFILRTPTGNAAERYFINYFNQRSLPISGKLIDCRDLGCGFDFQINTEEGEFYIEVKGLSEISGGILFTDKEWQTAANKGDKFFLCIIKNLNNEPSINFIQNPASKFNPKKNIYTTIQINWSISENEIKKING